MSIKTLRKRIALVAVSALGVGLLSVAPASAAITQLTSLALNKSVITAGTEAITATVTGVVATPDLGVSIRVQSPTGSLTYGFGGAAGTDSSGITNTALASAATTFTIAAGNLLEPGTWTICGVSGAAAADVDTAGEVNTGSQAATGICSSVNVLSPATATAMGISMDAGIYAIDSQPTVRAWRPTNGVTGEIKFRADRSADANLPAGEVADGADTTSTTGSYDTLQLAADEDDVAGTYTYTAWVDTNDDNLVNNGEVSASITFYISSATASTDVITITQDKTVANDDDNALICATITDAYGRPLVNAITLAADVDYFDTNGGTATNIGTSGVAMTRQGSSNNYCLTIGVNSAAITSDYEDVVLTVSNAAGTASETVDFRVVLVSGTTIPTTAGAQIISLEGGDGIGSVTSGVRQTLYATGGANIGTSTATTGMIQIDKSLTTQTFKLAIASTQAGEYVKVVITPKAAQAASIIASGTRYYQITADGTLTFTVTSVAPTAGSGYTMTITGDQTSIAYIQYATATPQITVSPSAEVKAAYLSTTAFTASLTDQFARPMSGKTLVYNVSGGRNATVTGTLTTGTDGAASFNLVDKVGSADTVNDTDTVTFTYNYLDSLGDPATATGSGSVEYSATGVVVGSLTVTPSSTADVTLSQTSNTGSTTYVAHTVQVYLSTGLPAGAGVLVTCSGGADDLFLLGVKTAVTGAAGTATCNVYRVKSGNTAIKASAGGKTSNTGSTVLFKNDAGATAEDGTGAVGTNDARNIVLNAAQSVDAGSAATVTATVTDRWGNPVAGVPVTWSYSGVGRPVTGADLTVATNTLGQAQIQMTSLSTEYGDTNVLATMSTTTNQALDSENYVSPSGSGTLYVAGVKAGNYTATSKISWKAVAVGVSNAEVLAAIVKLIASINKQIRALQKSLKKK